MKFVCSKTILNEIVNTVQKAISQKSAHPILECIKIYALTYVYITKGGE